MTRFNTGDFTDWLLVRFRKRWNHPLTKTFKWLSANSFLVFIIHPVFVTYISYWLRDVSLHPLLKIVFVCCPALPLCFAAALIIRRIPGAKRVV